MKTKLLIIIVMCHLVFLGFTSCSQSQDTELDDEIIRLEQRLSELNDIVNKNLDELKTSTSQLDEKSAEIELYLSQLYEAKTQNILFRSVFGDIKNDLSNFKEPYKDAFIDSAFNRHNGKEFIIDYESIDYDNFELLQIGVKKSFCDSDEPCGFILSVAQKGNFIGQIISSVAVPDVREIPTDIFKAYESDKFTAEYFHSFALDFSEIEFSEGTVIKIIIFNPVSGEVLYGTLQHPSTYWDI